MNVLELTAVERLALSREKLRTEMVRIAGKPNPGAGENNHVTGLLGLLKAKLPNASLLIDALSQWWTHYTTQGHGQTAAGVAEDILKPLAKRHPLALVLSALALGGLVVWARPWRWAFKAPMLATWGPAMVSGALASATVQAWIHAALDKSPVAPPPDPSPPDQPTRSPRAG